MIFAVFDVHIAVNCVKTAALYIYICCFVIACAILVILDHTIFTVSELLFIGYVIFSFIHFILELNTDINKI